MKRNFKKPLVFVVALMLLCMTTAFAEGKKVESAPTGGQLLIDELLELEEDEQDVDDLALSTVSGSAPSQSGGTDESMSDGADESKPDGDSEDPEDPISSDVTDDSGASEEPEEEPQEELEKEPEEELGEELDGELEELDEEPEEELEGEEDREPLNVTIHASYPSEPRLGDTVNLVSTVTGAEDGSPLRYQWQYCAPGGSWTDADGGNNSTYSFVISERNAGYTWKLIVERLG